MLVIHEYRCDEAWCVHHMSSFFMPLCSESSDRRCAARMARHVPARYHAHRVPGVVLGEHRSSSPPHPHLSSHSLLDTHIQLCHFSLSLHSLSLFYNLVLDHDGVQYPDIS